MERQPEGTGGPQRVSIDSLDAKQASEIFERLQKQLQGVTERTKALRIASRDLTSAKETVRKMDIHGTSDEALVPLSPGVYVPATIDDPHKVLVDLGAGYYVEQTASEAKDYIDSRLKTAQNLEANCIAETITLSEFIAMTQNRMAHLHPEARAGA